MISFTEKDRLQDLLEQEKTIVKVYGTFITEASTEELRTLFKQCMFECSDDQYEVYEKMTSRNYYSPKAAQMTEITQTKTQFESVKNQLTAE